MEPLASLVTALAAGAAAALQSTVKQSVKDGYAALKRLIQRKYTRVNVDQLEANPTSKSRRGVVEEDLKAAGAETDAEVLQQAQALLEAIQRQAPEMATAIGVDLKDIEGTARAIRRVTATGAGVKVEHAKLSGDITSEGQAPWEVQAICGELTQVDDTVEVILTPAYDPFRCVVDHLPVKVQTRRR